MAQNSAVPMSHRLRLLLVVCLGVGFVLASCGGTSAAPTRDQTVAKVKSSLQGLDRFNTSKSLDELQSSIVALTSAVDLPRIHRSRYVARRRLIVRAWAQILRAIETSNDPTFDQSHSGDLP